MMVPFSGRWAYYEAKETKMMNRKYSMSFTTGGLLYVEAVKLAKLYEELQDWDAVRTRVISQNLLQARTQSTLLKLYRVTAARLKCLSMNERHILAAGSRQEQYHILWLGICKQYEFIKDFAVEVIREKFLRLDFNLTHSDYNRFFNGKAEEHDYLDNLTGQTREKLRQVIFKMIRDIGLLAEDNKIIPQLLPPLVKKTIAKDSPEFMVIFPCHHTGL